MPQPEPHIFFIKNSLNEISRTVAWLEKVSTEKKWSIPLTMQLNLLIEEWITNIISYAYEDDIEHTIEISIHQENELIHLQFIDDGKAFNPTIKADPNLDLPIEEREIGGLGIFFIKENSDEFHYSRVDNKNIVTIVKSNQAESSV